MLSKSCLISYLVLWKVRNKTSKKTIQLKFYVYYSIVIFYNKICVILILYNYSIHHEIHRDIMTSVIKYKRVRIELNEIFNFSNESNNTVILSKTFLFFSKTCLKKFKTTVDTKDMDAKLHFNNQ